jgi:hypothetical protein
MNPTHLPPKPTWKNLYGWTLQKMDVPTGETDNDGKPITVLVPAKQYSHAPRAMIMGAPKRGGVASTRTLMEITEEIQNSPAGLAIVQRRNLRIAKRIHECQPVRYIVWHDRSLRRVDKIMKKALPEMSPEQVRDMMEQLAAKQQQP